MENINEQGEKQRIICFNCYNNKYALKLILNGDLAEKFIWIDLAGMIDRRIGAFSSFIKYFHNKLNVDYKDIPSIYKVCTFDKNQYIEIMDKIESIAVIFRYFTHIESTTKDDYINTLKRCVTVLETKFQKKKKKKNYAGISYKEFFLL